MSKIINLIYLAFLLTYEMHSEEHVGWLEKNNLIDSAKSSSACMKKVFQECLNSKNEDVLIIGDRGIGENKIAGIVAGSYYYAAKELGMNPKLIIQEPRAKGDAADENVLKALKELKHQSIVVLALSGALGSLKGLGKKYREHIKENEHRFVSMTSLGSIEMDKLPILMKAIDVDYAKLREQARMLKERFDKGKELRIMTDAGTDITIELEADKTALNSGDFRAFGSGGNIPAGEVYLPPKWRKAEGKVVVDCSSRHRGGTQAIKEAIILKIEKGEVVDISGGNEAIVLKESLDWAGGRTKHAEGVKLIGEIGIGLNQNAEILGSALIDEKVFGTAHIAIGSNYLFGGTIRSILHLDQIFKNPKIYLDNEEIKLHNENEKSETGKGTQ